VVDYDRAFGDGTVNAIVGRTALTLSVLAQLGPNYQTLPGYAAADYQAQADALKANVDALQVHLDAILPLLKSIDADAGALDLKNKGLLRTLQELLKGQAQASLLDQITGPTPRRKAAAPVPPLTPPKV